AADRADDDPGPGGLARGLRFRPVGLTSSWEFDRADLRAIEIPQSVIQVLRDVLGAVLVAGEITAKRVIIGVIAEQDDNSAVLIDPRRLDLAPIYAVLEIVIGLDDGFAALVALVIFRLEDLEGIFAHGLVTHDADHSGLAVDPRDYDDAVMVPG